ncbi:hypothetical protein [Poseidonocella sp. HB161398]|uniref:hypothetical protein n=1 Tax=Poseidonocella sp. HB161398 TaxID=2320855 RepID=UPI001F0FE422|nr:hypothetical protein [Poseidonocella sp. HB161398]
MFDPASGVTSGGRRSDGYCISERDPTLGIAGTAFDPGDVPADGRSWRTIRKCLRARTVDPQFQVPERSNKLETCAARLEIEAGKP